MKFKKALAVALVLLFSTTAFFGCSKKDDVVSSIPVSSEIISSAEPSHDMPPVEEAIIANPLTGETLENEEILKQRPVAVMINNIKVALPQAGVSTADVIYELPVEGGVTRLMALFSDYKNLPTIGSVRSARHDYIELIKPFDPLYVHFGASTSGDAAISKNEIKAINGLQYANLAFYMDSERAKTRSSEHCWFTTTDLVAKGIEKLKFSMDLDEPIAPLFNFAKPDVDVMADNAAATPATSIDFTVGNGVKAGFTYNEQTKTYDKTQQGAPHIDSNTGKPISPTNVFLMYTKAGLMPDNYHREVVLESGEGYYISMGKAIEVNFKKDSVTDYMRVIDKDGNDVLVNAGRTYFGVVDTSGKEKLQVAG